MTFRIFSRIAFTATFVLAAACGGERPDASSDAPRQSSSRPVTVKGSDTMVIMTQRLAEEYMKANAGRIVQVNGGGSGTGIAALINGTIDLAQASRPMKDDERSKAEAQRHSKIVETPVALDALAAFVNAANPVKELRIDQLAAIYTGKVKNWKELGGSDAPIILYGRESSSGTYDYFREHVMQKADFSPIVQTLQGTAAIINAVGKDPNGIGYGGIAYAKEVRPLAISSKEGVTAVAPTEATVKDGSYPLSRKLFFYYPESAPAGVREFVQWTLTPEAQRLVVSVGYFPLTDAPAALEPSTAAGTSTDATSGNR